VRFRGIHAGIANFTRGSGTHSCGCPDGRHGKGPLPTTHCDWPGHYCDWIGTAVPHPLHLFAKGHIKAPWCTLPRASSCTPESAACCAPNDAVWQVSVRAPPVSASPTPPPTVGFRFCVRTMGGWMWQWLAKENASTATPVWNWAGKHVLDKCGRLRLSHSGWTPNIASLAPTIDALLKESPSC
jgi:hypothetical protein